MDKIRHTEPWEQFFDREVSKHPELNEKLVAALRQELIERDIYRGRHTANRGEQDALLIEHARRIIHQAHDHLRRLVKLQEYDEYRERHPVPMFTPEVLPHEMPYDDLLDEILGELDDGDEPSATRQTEDMPLATTSSPGAQKKAERSDEGIDVPSTTKQSNIVRTSPSASSKFTYPALPFDLSCLTHDGLTSRSVELASEFRMNGDYNAIREEFVQVSLALNQFKRLAPVFRDQPRMPFKRTEWKRFTQLLIDQIVIDLHWLHCRGEKVNPVWPELQALLAPSSKFDCVAIANRLAAKNWSSDFRVNELIFVNDRQQRQLMQLRSKALKETFRSVLEGKGKPDKADGRVAAKKAAVRMAIANWADRRHQIRGHEDMYESLWVARTLLSAKASYDDIGELAALRCGKPALDRKTVEGKLKTLDAKLKEAGVA